MTHWQSRIYCILDSNNKSAGTGVLLDDWHIITCAHVIGKLFELGNQNSYEGQIVKVRQLYSTDSASDQSPSAKIVHVFSNPKPDEVTAKDIALLKLNEPLSLSNIRWRPIEKGECETIACINGNVSATVNLKGEYLPAPGVLECHADPVEIELGFSGAPVYHTESESFVGLMVARRSQGSRAYLIGAASINEQLNQIGISLKSDVLPSVGKKRRRIFIVVSGKGGTGKTLLGLLFLAHYEQNRQPFLVFDMNWMNTDLRKLFRAAHEYSITVNSLTDQGESYKRHGSLVDFFPHSNNVKIITPSPSRILPNGDAGFWQALNEFANGPLNYPQGYRGAFDPTLYDVFIDTNMNVTNLASGPVDIKEHLQNLSQHADIYICMLYTWNFLTDATQVTEADEVIGLWLRHNHDYPPKIVHVLNPAAFYRPNDGIAHAIEVRLRQIIVEAKSQPQRGKVSWWESQVNTLHDDLLKRLNTNDLFEEDGFLKKVSAPIETVREFAERMNASLNQRDNSDVQSWELRDYGQLIQSALGETRPKNVLVIPSYLPSLSAYTEQYAIQPTSVTGNPIKSVTMNMGSMLSHIGLFLNSL